MYVCSTCAYVRVFPTYVHDNMVYLYVILIIPIYIALLQYSSFNMGFYLPGHVPVWDSDTDSYYVGYSSDDSSYHGHGKKHRPTVPDPDPDPDPDPEPEPEPDHDGDGIPDATDPDDDNDGIPDTIDATPLGPIPAPEDQDLETRTFNGVAPVILLDVPQFNDVTDGDDSYHMNHGLMQTLNADWTLSQYQVQIGSKFPESSQMAFGVYFFKNAIDEVSFNFSMTIDGTAGILPEFGSPAGDGGGFPPGGTPYGTVTVESRGLDPGGNPIANIDTVNINRSVVTLNQTIDTNAYPNIGWNRFVVTFRQTEDQALNSGFAGAGYRVPITSITTRVPIGLNYFQDNFGSQRVTGDEIAVDFPSNTLSSNPSVSENGLTYTPSSSQRMRYDHQADPFNDPSTEDWQTNNVYPPVNLAYRGNIQKYRYPTIADGNNGTNLIQTEAVGGLTRPGVERVTLIDPIFFTPVFFPNLKTQVYFFKAPAGSACQVFGLWYWTYPIATKPGPVVP